MYLCNKSLLNTLGRAVEQLAGCSRGQSTTDRQRQREGLKCAMNI